MAKLGESRRIGKLTRSRNVPSFDESTENAKMTTTMSVVADVHTEAENPDRRRRRGSDEHSDEKEARRRSSETTSKVSSRVRDAFRSSGNSSKNRSRHSSANDLTVESLDLIEELETMSKKSESPEEKPRRRKQWSTVASLANDVEADAKKLPRRRWSKDTGVIRLPETKDEDVSPLIGDAPRRPPPVPAPRSSVPSNATYHFDNPAFVSENEDEVLRIETDHNRESTRIEMRRMSNHSDTTIRSSGSSRKHRRDVADNDDRSSARTRSTASRRDSTGEEQELSGVSAASLEKITDLRTSSSITSEARSATSERKSRKPEATRDRMSGREEGLLFKKKELPNDKIVVSSARDADSAVTRASTETRVRKKKKKRKRKEQEKEEEVKEKEEMRYVSVTVHRADVLAADYVTAKRPMVKVHIVEARTGSYLKSAASNRESAYLQPMITGKFDFKENRSMIPVWEEELIFEHDFDEIIRREDGDQVVILFEVIDLLSFAEASLSYDRVGSEGCWKKIAWAFLKPVGNKVLHVDKKVRLQLYRPKRNFKRYGKHKCEVYTWWRSNDRDKYPSSLLVTVTSVPPPKHEPILYQQLPLHELLGDVRSDSRIPSTRTSECTSIGLPKWARMAAQSCKIPNERIYETEASENGCFYVAFSNDGKYLACVHSEEYNYPIVVYEVESGKIHVRFLGHKTFVYSLSWSGDDRHLLSASADQTARIWDVGDQIVQHVEMLPHPSYVYCATYGPDRATIVATGCYDRAARIWANDKKSRKLELCQELEGHEGFVNTIVFQKNGNLITADSVGSIILWAARKNNRMPSRREWRSARKIKVREIEGVVVNTVALHPLESRLLVHSRDNGLRMLDLATGVVLQKYRQLHNQRIQVKACISPCGGLVLCGGEDSTLNIWNLETGKHVARYNRGRSLARVVITCVDYHPYDHVLAYSTFGSPSTVTVLRFNKNASGDDVGLSLAEDTLQTQSNEVILNVSGNPPSRQSKSSGNKAASSKIEIFSSSNHPATQIHDDDTTHPWTKLRRLREMERSWKEKGQDQLYRIIQKIDSLLSKKSMFPEDVVEYGKQNGNNSWIEMESGDSSSNVARDMSIVVHSAGRHDNTRSSVDTRSLTRSRSQDRSSDLHLTALFETTAALSRQTSPDSTGTYVIEFENEIVARSKDVKSGRAHGGSSSSCASHTTFVIEKERA